MSSAVILRKYSATSISVVVVALGFAAAEIYVVDYGISYQDVIVTVILLAAFWTFAARDRRLKAGLVFLVLTFGLGYRTMEVTPSLRVHPSELVLWGLLALPMVQRSKLKLWLPFWLILFIPFWLWGWWPLVAGDVKWEAMLSEFKNFIVLIPLYFVAGSVLVKQSGWRSVLLAFYLVGAWIAAMGILEYIYPEIKTLFPNFVSIPSPLETEEGFQRARFSFWGTQDAIYICVLALPIGAAVWEWWSMWWQRALNLLIVAFMLSGIYISGHRNAWMMITLQGLGLAVVKKQYLLAIAVLLVFFSIYQVLPDATRARINSGTELVSGQPISSDTSGQKRWDRASMSLSNTLAHPLGTGWSTAGWVHNDFLQVAENLGVMAGALFLGIYVYTLGRLWRRVRTASLLREQRALGTTLFLSFACAGVILATDANLVLPQLILPIWFIWVIGEIWLRQTRMKRTTTDDASFDLGPFADLQLCGDRSPYVGSGQMGR